MRLFNKQAQPEKIETEWEDCVDYLRALDQQDYNKILKVVKVYRDADQAVKKILKIKQDAWGRGLGEDDTELGDFLEDSQPAAKKVEVK